jgi:hypothetical protein
MKRRHARKANHGRVTELLDEVDNREVERRRAAQRGNAPPSPYV